LEDSCQSLLRAAATIKRTHLELGGKAPVIVYNDADLEAVVQSIRTFGFYNAGQDCTAPRRIYVQDGAYENFVTDLTAAVSTIRYNQADDTSNGAPTGPSRKFR